MKSPKQSAPVDRHLVKSANGAVVQSCCPGGKQCYGICILGTCTGLCI